MENRSWKGIGRGASSRLLLAACAAVSLAWTTRAEASSRVDAPMAICSAAGAGASKTVFASGAQLARHRAAGATIGPCPALAETLTPPSGSVVDCQGRALAAANPWSARLAILLSHVEGVTIRNCVLSPGSFEMGILVLGGGRHTIVDNELHASLEAVKLEATEGVLVQRNRIFGGPDEFTVRFGRGARHNQLVGNSIVTASGGVAMYDHAEQDGSVTNYFVNGRLYQVPLTAGTHGPVENLVEGNRIDASAGWFGIGNAVRSRRNVVRNNQITGGENGMIMFGVDDNDPNGVAGVCAGSQPEWDATSPRYCRYTSPPSPDLDDCNIPYYDDTPIGPCIGAGTFIGDNRVDEPLFENNKIRGTAIGLQMWLTRNARVRGNTFSGDPARNGFAGIIVAEHSVESAVVTGNRVSGYENGLWIFPGAGGLPGFTFTGNDVRAPQPVVADGLFTQRLDGNHWGRSGCPAFDLPDTTYPLVADCAPYPMPIAMSQGGQQACPVSSVPQTMRSLCLFDAPAAVSGAGAAAVPVSFRYDGPYAAVPHGLAAPTVVKGSAATGDFLRFEIDVPPGTRHLRVALDGQEAGKGHAMSLLLFANEDVEDPVKASRRPGALQSLDLPDPEPRRYLAYVAAGIVDGESAPFTLKTWMVPDAAGSLAVTAAPAAAVFGLTGSVTVAGGAGEGPLLGTIDHVTGSSPARTTVIELRGAEP